MDLRISGLNLGEFFFYISHERRQRLKLGKQLRLALSYRCMHSEVFLRSVTGVTAS
jgi:hypothetical protein